jgi:hypothetical protein
MKISIKALRKIIKEQLQDFEADVETISCPLATRDIKANTNNRNTTRDNHSYGPLNPAKPSIEFWQPIAEKWSATVDEAMSSRCANCIAFDISPRMKECMPLIDEGLDKKFPDDVPGFNQKKYPIQFGYCWMHHFKCLSARTCDTWAGGGPITDSDTSNKWQAKAKNI